MLATAPSFPASGGARSNAPRGGEHNNLCLNSPPPLGVQSTSPRVNIQSSTVGLTITASATAEAMPVTTADNELTNLGWLHKPGVLNSMCTALTGSPHKHSRTGTRLRKPKLDRFSSERGTASGGVAGNKSESVRSRGAKDSDKMVNVILNVRNRKYNGEDAHKPPLSFACMIFMAIESSPTKTLPVKDIYDWIMWKFPYYQHAPGGWKNSIRHNLSLNKCFKKVDRFSPKSKSAMCKGGLWTVDPDYRRSLLAALKRSPYHPYHRYFTPPLSPSSSSSSLDGLDPAERDAALTMCMISGGENGSPIVTSELLQAILHDHCYSKKPPNFVVPPLPRRRRRTGLTLDEVAAAAEMILAQDEAAAKEGAGHESSDEGIGGEMDSDCECEDEDGEGQSSTDCLLGDSGYGGQSMEELGADALLCLAGSSRSNTPPPS